MKRIKSIPPTQEATRKPIRDVMGDKHSLGILVFEGESLNKCRELSGEPRIFDKEYAVWYSSHDIIAYIGGQKLVVSRPYAFYNTNQHAGMTSVEWEPEDALLLHDTYKELRTTYNKKYVESESVNAFYNKLVDIITKHYTMAKYNNDLSDFTEYALASLHITEASVEKIKMGIEDTVKCDNPDVTDVEQLEDIAYKEAIDLAIRQLITDTYEVNPDITDEQIEEEALYWATEKLMETGDIVGALPADVSEESLQEIVATGKLGYIFVTTALHTLHAHPRGVNAFSGATIQGDTPIINGTGGDLLNAYTEIYNATTNKWEMTPDSKLGIVYPWSGEGASFPLPSYAGVVQQIDKVTQLAFNELRQWRVNEATGDYTYARTPLLTYVTSYTSEVEKLPLLSSMLGVVAPRFDHDDYVVPYLGAKSVEMTEEIFQAFHDHPLEVAYDIDSDRVLDEDVSTHRYGDNHTWRGNDYKKKYPSKGKMIAWIIERISQGNAFKKLWPNKVYSRKSLGKLSNKKLQTIVDKIVTFYLFGKSTTKTKNTLEDMNKVFNMFDKDLLAFATKRDGRKQVVDYFLDIASPSLFRWEKLRKANIAFDDIIGKTSEELNKLLPSTTSPHNDHNTHRKTYWPITAKDLEYGLACVGIQTSESYYENLRVVKAYINKLYSVPTDRIDHFWTNMMLFDIDFTDLLEPITAYYAEELADSLVNWGLSKEDTEELINAHGSFNKVLKLSTTEAMEKLVEYRKAGKSKFRKKEESQYTIAVHLSTVHGKYSIAEGGSTYSVYARQVKDAAISLFNSLYVGDIAKIVPKDMSPQRAVTLLDKLQISKVDFLGNKEATDILSALGRLGESEINELSVNVAPYTDDPAIFLSYVPTNIDEVTVWTSKDISNRLDVPIPYAVEVLQTLGITKYTTAINDKEVQVSINATNAQLALTDVTLEYVCTGLSKADADTVIKNINLVEVDVQELLSSDKSAYYVAQLTNLGLTKDEVFELQSSGKTWQDILAYKKETTNYTGLPYRKVVNGQTVFFANIDHKIVSISEDVYTQLCEEMCVITSITKDGKGGVATTVSGHSLRINDVSKYNIGDICRPAAAQ